ncbi:urease accessory protein UreD [Actinomadura macrotermitis]|uniref:Urease accessory protein UreD n=1 Tax=Actinomadura macrotermitis TaxID=2585200 RepID=A0A7K0BS66_9ACTN|nr:urease accessory protein UreD [Actinomadura macrotermitis]MQY03524.1 Urease accessory protein UreD [Actinomadura macrotermitis]
MKAAASLRVELDAHRRRTVIGDLRSASPIRLVPRRGKVAAPGGALTVCLVESAAAPIGGDRLDLHVRVGAGAWLRLVGTGATLALPGHDGDHSRVRVHLRVDPAGTVEYLPEATVIGARADHRAETRLDLAAGARARCRELLVLGRHGELPGRGSSTTHVLRDGAPLLRQRLEVGRPRLAASAGHLAGARVLGSEILVWDRDPAAPSSGDWWSLTPLAHGGSVATSMAGDTATARRRLAEAVGHHPAHRDRSDRPGHG